MGRSLHYGTPISLLFTLFLSLLGAGNANDERITASNGSVLSVYSFGDLQSTSNERSLAGLETISRSLAK